MDVPSLGLHSERGTDTYPLLMERSENANAAEHVIDIQRSIDASSPSSTHDRTSNGSEVFHREERASSSTRASAPQSSASSSNGINSRNPSTVRRGDARRRRSPLNSGLWISIELVLTVSQIVASIVVLALSKDENPHAPLRVWIIGYACGCVATLPLLYWRYCHRSPGSDQESTQSRQTSQISMPAGPFSLSVTRTSEGDDRRSNGTSPRGSQNAVMSARVKVLVEYFKMALDCFFAVWFVVGNVWIFGGHSSASEAPNMYRLCIVFLTFSCIGYAMPFILCATICCCLPCIISILGFREDLAQTRGATPESIDALPTYKFKVKRSRSDEDRDTNSAGEGGIVAAGTEKERVISGEDAVCCICLAKYANNDELKELPCCHFFHKDCVDKWLKINASCPLCKSEVGENLTDAQSGTSAAILASLSGGHDNSQRRSERRVGDGLSV